MADYHRLPNDRCSAARAGDFNVEHTLKGTCYSGISTADVESSAKAAIVRSLQADLEHCTIVLARRRRETIFSNACYS